MKLLGNGLKRESKPKLFSIRYGFDPLANAFQTEGMDIGLRTRLWNIIYVTCLQRVHMNTRPFVLDLWTNFLKKNIQMVEDPSAMVLYAGLIQQQYERLAWYRVYDLLQFIALEYPFDRSPNPVTKKEFVDTVNRRLEEECSAYRMLGDLVTPITSAEQRETIAQASSASPTPIGNHLKKALALLSDKQSPDYVNSMKESISAVEAICKIVADDENADLACALKVVKKRIGLHGALEKALSSLYGFSSSHGGIRHASVKEGDQNLNVHMAVFFLTVCSAFVNYLVAESTRLGIDLKRDFGETSPEKSP